MTKLVRLWDWWATVMDFWSGKLTIQENMRQRRQKAESEVKAATDSIVSKKYERHMALSEIVALDAWEKGNIRENSD